MRYEKGQSVKEALNIIGEKTVQQYESFHPINSPVLEKVNLSPTLRPLQVYAHALIWCGTLISNGKLLDDELDEHFNNLIPHDDSFYSQTEELKSILTNLLQIRTSIRNFEIDTEEFLHTMAVTETFIESNITQSAIEMMKQINSSYDRAYNLTLYKLKNISNARVVVTNVAISVVAVIISVMAFLKG